MKLKFDILVVGGGPAGCAFALGLINLNPQLRILILERGDYLRPRVGETLPPQCRVLLERLGIWEEFLLGNHLPAFGSLSSWGSEHAVSQEFLTSVERNGWHLDRNRFDRFLADQVRERGVELWENSTFQEANHLETGGWILVSEGKEIQCQILVDATGRSAGISRLAGANVLLFDRLVGTMAILESGSQLNRDTLVEAAAEGWWYSALLPDQKMAAAFFTDANQVKLLEIQNSEGWVNQLQTAPLTQARLSGLFQPENLHLRTWPAQSQRSDQVIGRDWLAVGDAAAAFDPLSSQGIFFALRSGLMGAFAAIDLLEGGETAQSACQKYSFSQLEQFMGYWEVKRDFYAMEQRWADRPFWRLRQGKIALSPTDKLILQPASHKKCLFFSPTDLGYLRNSYPGGATAAEFMAALRKIRPDLPPGHALEGLQMLVEDGFATQNIPELQS